jgi:hypothetical protein
MPAVAADVANEHRETDGLRMTSSALFLCPQILSHGAGLKRNVGAI